MLAFFNAKRLRKHVATCGWYSRNDTNLRKHEKLHTHSQWSCLTVNVTFCVKRNGIFANIHEVWANKDKLCCGKGGLILRYKLCFEFKICPNC